MHKPVVAVLAGGNSAEHDISVKSAEDVMEMIDRDRFEPWLVSLKGLDWMVRTDDGEQPIDKNDFSFTRKGKHCRFDAAFIAIHGSPGEDGKLQGYLDMVGVPYTTCNQFVTSLTFDKAATKFYLRDFPGMKMARSILVTHEKTLKIDEILESISLPAFVKPNQNGSSFGISKVKTEEELSGAIINGFQYDNKILIEEFIAGSELTCAVLPTPEGPITFPITEIISHKEFFDYEAKYENASDEITPARVSDEIRDRCQALSIALFEQLRCSALVRFDYILQGEDFYFLEVNIVPGLTGNSLVPQQVRAFEKDTRWLYTQMLDYCLKAIPKPQSTN